MEFQTILALTVMFGGIFIVDRLMNIKPKPVKRSSYKNFKLDPESGDVVMTKDINTWA